MLAGAALSIRTYRNVRLQRRYPIAGTFNTVYEDLEDDDIVEKKAISTLLQKGREIQGQTVEIQSGRVWVLHGTLHDGGFIVGYYGADNPHDDGSGTFFLRVAGTEGHLLGLWSGYDSVNRKVSGGSYEFLRRSDFIVREAKRSDIADVVAILAESLGERYIDKEEVEAFIEAGDKACFVAVLEGKVIGAATVSTVAGREIASHFPSGQEGEAKQLNFLRQNALVGHLHSAAVVPRMRRAGVASELVRARLTWLLRQDARGAFAFGWVSESGCPIEGVLGAYGFEALGDISEFWRQEGEEEGFACPECDFGCRCSARLFVRRGTRGVENDPPSDARSPGSFRRSRQASGARRRTRALLGRIPSGRI